jgi:hypothetical protein
VLFGRGGGRENFACWKFGAGDVGFGTWMLVCHRHNLQGHRCNTSVYCTVQCNGRPSCSWDPGPAGSIGRTSHVRNCSPQRCIQHSNDFLKTSGLTIAVQTRSRRLTYLSLTLCPHHANGPLQHKEASQTCCGHQLFLSPRPPASVASS